MKRKKTKIIATIGPSSDKEEQIENLILNGVNVFRFNLKHNDIEWHNKRIKRVQKVANKLKAVVGILVDLQGPEIRIDTKEKKDISTKKGEKITIGNSFFSKEIQIAILNKAIFRILEKGDVLLIDDGFIEMKVLQKNKKLIKAEMVQEGKIKNKKGLNIPGKKIKLSSLIDQDIKRLDMIAINKVDFVALSFSRVKRDINVLKKEIEKRKMEAKVVAKIECQEALENIDELIEASDAIMIARGDLGIEVPIEQLAFWQKNIIKRCRASKKPVIIATQMLHSMTRNPRPTRAEAIDVATAVFDRVDSVMLSEETAMGKYPEKAVQSMTKILLFNEQRVANENLQLKSYNATELIVNSVTSLLSKKSFLKVEKVIVFTESGYTAQVMASSRPKVEVVAITNNQKTKDILTISFGIEPVYVPKSYSEKKIFDLLKEKKHIKEKEIVAIIRGRQKDKTNVLNSFSIIRIGN